MELEHQSFNGGADNDTLEIDLAVGSLCLQDLLVIEIDLVNGISGQKDNPSLRLIVSQI